jgi:SAM-dependent methyltransferase
MMDKGRTSDHRVAYHLKFKRAARDAGEGSLPTRTESDGSQEEGQSIPDGSPALYGELAKYYDRIYYRKDYYTETNKLRSIIRRYKQNAGDTLLDVGCGTGGHLSYLRKHFQCVGVDRSPEMLAIARSKLPNLELLEGDMTRLSLGRRFDVVVSLFSGVGYLLSKHHIRGAVRSFVRHLNPGGVLIIEPWIRESDWRKGDVGLQGYKTEEVKVARMDYGITRGNFSILDERYLIAEKNRGITYLSSRHVMRFFEPREWLDTMRDSGLVSEYLEESLMPKRGLLVGVKALTSE